MKLLVIAVATLLVAAAVFFLFLGYKSSGMDAPDFVDGKLPVCGDKPNCVSSRANADSEYFVEPLEIAGDDIAARLISAIEQTGGVVRLQSGGMLKPLIPAGCSVMSMMCNSPGRMAPRWLMCVRRRGWGTVIWAPTASVLRHCALH